MSTKSILSSCFLFCFFCFVLSLLSLERGGSKKYEIIAQHSVCSFSKRGPLFYREEMWSFLLLSLMLFYCTGLLELSATRAVTIIIIAHSVFDWSINLLKGIMGLPWMAQFWIKKMDK